MKRLEFFKNNMSVRVFHAFLGNCPTGTEDDEVNEFVDGSLVWLARLDA